MRLARLAVVSLSLSGAAVIVSAAPAHAAYFPCTYPYVCLYTEYGDSAWAERYQVVTSGWQTFARRDLHRARNTRNDDVALFHFTNGLTACVPSGTPYRVYNIRARGVPDAIRISSEPSCSSFPGYPVPPDWDDV